MPNPHRREKKPMNGAFGFLMKESRSLQEVHVVCNAKAHGLIRKAKLLAVRLQQTLTGCFVKGMQSKEAHT